MAHAMQCSACPTISRQSCRSLGDSRARQAQHDPEGLGLPVPGDKVQEQQVLWIVRQQRSEEPALGAPPKPQQQPHQQQSFGPSL